MICCGSDVQSGEISLQLVAGSKMQKLGCWLCCSLARSINSSVWDDLCPSNIDLGLPGPGPALRRWVKDIGDGARTLAVITQRFSEVWQASPSVKLLLKGWSPRLFNLAAAIICYDGLRSC